MKLFDGRSYISRLSYCDHYQPLRMGDQSKYVSYNQKTPSTWIAHCDMRYPRFPVDTSSFFLRHVHFYEIEFGSLDDLRRILGAIPNLHTAIFHSISWRDRDVHSRPLANATSSRLIRCSLSECTSNFVAPFFWAMPPISSETDAIVQCRGDQYHPPLCTVDSVPLIELAKFILDHETSESRPTCWEWRRNEEELGDCKSSFPFTWLLMSLSIIWLSIRVSRMLL